MTSCFRTRNNIIEVFTKPYVSRKLTVFTRDGVSFGNLSFVFQIELNCYLLQNSFTKKMCLQHLTKKSGNVPWFLLPSLFSGLGRHFSMHCYLGNPEILKTHSFFRNVQEVLLGRILFFVVVIAKMLPPLQRGKMEIVHKQSNFLNTFKNFLALFYGAIEILESSKSKVNIADTSGSVHPVTCKWNLMLSSICS